MIDNDTTVNKAKFVQILNSLLEAVQFFSVFFVLLLAMSVANAGSVTNATLGYIFIASLELVTIIYFAFFMGLFNAFIRAVFIGSYGCFYCFLVLAVGGLFIGDASLGMRVAISVLLALVAGFFWLVMHFLSKWAPDATNLKRKLLEKN